MENQKQFLQLANYLDDKSLQARAYKKIGNIYYANGQHESAIESHEAFLKVIKSADTHFPNDCRKQSKAMRVLGKIGCRGVGQLEKAISNRKSQFENAVNLKDTVRAFENLINDYELNGDYEEALHLQEKYFKVAKKLGGDAHGKACVNIARVHLAKGYYGEAIRKVETAEKLDNAAVKAREYGVMGCVYTDLVNMKRRRTCIVNKCMLWIPTIGQKMLKPKGTLGLLTLAKVISRMPLFPFKGKRNLCKKYKARGN